MKDKGLIELDLSKTKIARSVTLSSAKVYRPTRDVLDHINLDDYYGGIKGNLSKLTGGPQDFELNNIHGKLVYKYKINSMPDNDPIEWDRVNELKNGTTHKIKYLEGAEEQKGTIELFKGSEQATVTMKPRLKGTDTDEIVEKLNSLSWGIYRDLKRNGYNVGVPERSGEAKFTILSDQLPDEYQEGDNFLVDKSEGKKELHPQTGDFESNAEMSKMLTETGYMAEASKKIDRVENKVDTQAQVITNLTQVVNDLVDQLGGVGEKLEDKYDSSPGGMQYG